MNQKYTNGSKITKSRIIKPLSVVLELMSSCTSSAMAKSIGFGSDGSNSDILAFETLDVFILIVSFVISVFDSAALTIWGELNWLKRVNEMQNTKIVKLIKTSFT